MKTVTVKWLRKKGACIGAMAKLSEKGNPELSPEKLIKLCMKEQRFDYANWLIVRVMNKKQKVQYAIYAAKQVLKIFEKRYPEDKRPRQAIAAAEAYIKNPCRRTKTAAYAAAAAAYAADAAAYAADAADAAADAADAADAAAAAAYAAYAAAYAAYAAYAAAAAAAYAADAAADAAYAAYAAAYAAKIKLQRRIINNGLKILRG